MFLIKKSPDNHTFNQDRAKQVPFPDRHHRAWPGLQPGHRQELLQEGTSSGVPGQGEDSSRGHQIPQEQDSGHDRGGFQVHPRGP